jgi:hypothetical protein
VNFSTTKNATNIEKTKATVIAFGWAKAGCGRIQFSPAEVTGEMWLAWPWGRW